MKAMPRSLITVDLVAIRHNVGVLRGLLASAELWVVVKADGYGHGAVAVGRTALEAGATALGVATLGEALELRAALPEARIVLLGPAPAAAARPRPRGAARAVRLLRARRPTGVSTHLKLDTGMGRWGLSELDRAGIGRRRPDEPFRLGRHRPGVHRRRSSSASSPRRRPTRT